MHKNIIVLVYGLFLVSCGSGNTEQNQEAYAESEQAPVKIEIAEDEPGRGATLIKKSDCNTCHHITGNIVGPSYTEVAKKYEFKNKNIQLIAERIMKGSSGVWGQVMMIPHPGISREDAEKMARYILSLDGGTEPD